MFHRLDQLEAPLCRQLNRWAETPVVNFFQLASWLGNGPVWGVLLAGLVAYQPVIGIVLVGMTLLNAAIYRLLKGMTVRRRPFERWGMVQGARALDEFSFPSGHTLHAVALTTACWLTLPILGVVLLPLAIAIALSRVVLGLHYPSDVLMGALLGGVVAYSAVG